MAMVVTPQLERASDHFLPQEPTRCDDGWPPFPLSQQVRETDAFHQECLTDQLGLPPDKAILGNHLLDGKIVTQAC